MRQKSVEHSTNDFHDFYRYPGIMTDPKKYGYLFSGLPSNIPELCGIVQNLFLHLHWAERYHVSLSQARKDESNLRMVARQLEQLLRMDDSPLTVERTKEKRVIGTCRDYATFLSAILRYQGISARARCGFGKYFLPSHYEDHWVCEYWRDDQKRWVMVDAQLDNFQQQALNIDFNPSDMPPGCFIIAGEAWRMCRRGEADPENFGIFDMHGMWFIAGNLVRDLLSLNKVELLPWDSWQCMETWQPGNISANDIEWLDTLAEITLAGNSKFHEVRSVFGNDLRLKPPTNWNP